MFQPIRKDPNYSYEEKENLEDRWGLSSCQRHPFHKKVYSCIQNGSSLKYLEDGDFPSLKHSFIDLRGVDLRDITCHFEQGDHFKGGNLQYSSLDNLHFTNAGLNLASFDFSTLSNCTFINCSFACSSLSNIYLYQCKFINCEFIRSIFENSEFHNCLFEKPCFIEHTPFKDCYFSSSTQIKNIEYQSKNNKKNILLEKERASLFTSIQSAYEVSGSDTQALEYYKKAKHNFTRHNQTGFKKIVGYFNEFITGYGTQPLLTLRAMALIIGIGILGFSYLMPVKDSVLFVAGAFFTFGAFSHHLDSMGLLLRVMYISFSFMGIALSGIFIATWINIMFRSNLPKETLQSEHTDKSLNNL